ncbi:DUF2849 domain-containing protein [Pseudemcibacter aquimaris]|uniref:DUF2849 domain-containing protein n=1 Tax=Pseudemcibacter aquimaris TaxID=2857064 RepID=UPI002011064F|nr:DUF2849 domain-containing protein [Pseudemcibacter aquimaris]MCC3861195.1 DUF2849 domain-containing protein [Pseudemcibacter aquimaris]WDU57970.1 DUF2849 domain-containing protein [Pseudemcibacter aquimaris]
MSKKSLTLKIITGNRLKDGVVVYFDGEKWSEDIQFSLVSSDEDHLKKEALKTIDDENLISVEIIPVELSGSDIRPLSMREKIRSNGPTIEYSAQNNQTRRGNHVPV